MTSDFHRIKRLPPYVFEQVNKLKAVRGQDFQLRAGAPVQVTIPVRKRTALQYAFEPLLGTLRRSG